MRMNLAKLAILAFSSSLLSLLFAGGSSATPQLTTLCVFGVGNCAITHDGYYPAAALLRDSTGTLYGTTSVGGPSNDGVVFELSSSGTYTEIHDFCQSTCSDGQTPLASLIMDVNGNLYGTTSSGGAYDGGVVFRLSPPSGGGGWTYTILHSFCPSTCSDGGQPSAELTYAGASSGSLYDGTSALYGTTRTGGPSDDGTVFSLTPSGGSWTEKPIHKFCCGSPADGFQPSSGLFMDSSGNLYGTARGGITGTGVVYQLAPNGTGWDETILYNFCQTAGVVTYCADGESPAANVVMDGSGNLYGTTLGGGTTQNLSVNGGGVVFKLLNPANNSGQECLYGTTHYWCESVSYSFCTVDAACSDGASPSGGIGLFIDPSTGSMYGTTTNGGANTSSNQPYGVIFKVHGTTEHVLYSFCTPPTCSDGQMPVGGLIQDALGNFYGTTYYGGNSGGAPHYGYGTVYKFKP